jgi:hypothetical protein
MRSCQLWLRRYLYTACFFIVLISIACIYYVHHDVPLRHVQLLALDLTGSRPEPPVVSRPMPPIPLIPAPEPHRPVVVTEQVFRPRPPATPPHTPPVQH